VPPQTPTSWHMLLFKHVI